MDAKTALERLDDMVIVDVREGYEVAEGHLPGAVHIPLGQLPHRMYELDRTTPVLVVCATGQRSSEAQAFLTANGFDAHNLDGGMWGWGLRQLPVVYPDDQRGS